MISHDRRYADIVARLQTHTSERDMVGSDSLETNTLMNAAMRNNIRVMELLLTWQVNVNKTDTEDKTALVWAAESHSPAAIQLLLNKGADIGSVTSTNASAITYAASSENSAVLAILLDQCPKEEVKKLCHKYDDFDRLPLHWAAIKGKTDQCVMLCATGCEELLADGLKYDKTRTPQKMAADNGREETKNVLAQLQENQGRNCSW